MEARPLKPGKLFDEKKDLSWFGRDLLDLLVIRAAILHSSTVSIPCHPLHDADANDFVYRNHCDAVERHGASGVSHVNPDTAWRRLREVKGLGRLRKFE